MSEVAEPAVEDAVEDAVENAVENTEPITDRPVVRVVAGHPTPDELAALLTVLAAVGGGDASDVGGAAPSRWSAPGERLRTAYGAGSGAWRASGMPR